MRSARFFLTVIILNFFLTAHHGFALYDTLMEKLHSYAQVALPKKEDESVVVTFDSSDVLYFHPKVLEPFPEFESLHANKIGTVFKDISPLTFLLYVAYRQTSSISFEDLDEEELPEITEQIVIISQFPLLGDMLGSDKCPFQEIIPLIRNFIIEHISEERIAPKELRQLYADRGIPPRVWVNLLESLKENEAEAREKQEAFEREQKIQTTAEQFYSKIQKEMPQLENSLTKGYEEYVFNGAKTVGNNQVIYAESTSYRDRIVWEKVCKLHEENKQSPLELEVETTTKQAGNWACIAESLLCCLCCPCYCSWITIAGKCDEPVPHIWSNGNCKRKVKAHRLVISLRSDIEG